MIDWAWQYQSHPDNCLGQVWEVERHAFMFGAHDYE